MSVPIHPLAGYVVAQQEVASNKTASGLYIPDNAQEKPKIAKVLAVGPNVKQLKAGDKIIYGGYSTTSVKLDKEDYILVKEEDVLATVR